jgi:hypothetical protein
MYWSAGGFFGLPTLSTVAFTVTVPALCAGATTVQVFDDVQSTDLAFVAPKLNFVAVVPRANPAPLMVTLAPPATGPVFGLTLVTVGANLKRAFDEAVPPGVVTLRATDPGGEDGDTAVIDVAESDVISPAVEPKSTVVAPVRLVPLMVTVVPPVGGPVFGEIVPMVGGLGVPKASAL